MLQFNSVQVSSTVPLLCIQACNGASFQVRAPPGGLISDLKQSLYDQDVNPQGRSYYIVWNGRILLDDQPLEPFVNRPLPFRCRMRLRGGGSSDDILELWKKGIYDVEEISDIFEFNGWEIPAELAEAQNAPIPPSSPDPSDKTDSLLCDDLAVLDAEVSEYVDLIDLDGDFAANAKSMTGEELIMAYKEAIKSKVDGTLVDRWVEEVRSRESTKEALEAEQAAWDVIEGEVKELYESLGEEFLGVIRPNGAKDAPTGMMAYWAPYHKGEQVLFGPNYTMHRYITKGFDGGASQLATDWVPVKLRMTQHRALPSPDDASEAKLAEAIHCFHNNDTPDALDARRKIVDLGSRNQDRAVDVAATIPSFRFTLGVSVKKHVFARLSATVKRDPSLRLVSKPITISISPLPHLGVPVGTKQSFETQTVIKVDKEGQPVKILGVFFASPHASIAGYARYHRTANLFGQGQVLDAIANMAVVLSGKSVPEDQVSVFGQAYWPMCRSDPRTIKKDLVFLAHQQDQSRGAFVVTPDVIPIDVIQILQGNGEWVVENDPNDPRSFITRILSKQRKGERGRKSEDELRIWYKRISESLKKLDPERRNTSGLMTKAKWEALTEEEREAKKSRHSTATKAHWASLTPQQRAAAKGMSRMSGYLKADVETLQARYQFRDWQKHTIPSPTVPASQWVEYQIRRDAGDLHFYAHVVQVSANPIAASNSSFVVNGAMWNEINAIEVSSYLSLQERTEEYRLALMEPWWCKIKGVMYIRGVQRFGGSGANSSIGFQNNPGTHKCRMCESTRPIFDAQEHRDGEWMEVPPDACRPALGFKELGYIGKLNVKRRNPNRGPLDLLELDGTEWLHDANEQWGNGNDSNRLAWPFGRITEQPLFGPVSDALLATHTAVQEGDSFEEALLRGLNDL